MADPHISTWSQQNTSYSCNRSVAHTGTASQHVCFPDVQRVYTKLGLRNHYSTTYSMRNLYVHTNRHPQSKPLGYHRKCKLIKPGYNYGAADSTEVWAASGDLFCVVASSRSATRRCCHFTWAFSLSVHFLAAVCSTENSNNIITRKRCMIFNVNPKLSTKKVQEVAR